MFNDSLWGMPSHAGGARASFWPVSTGTTSLAGPSPWTTLQRSIGGLSGEERAGQ